MHHHGAEPSHGRCSYDDPMAASWEDLIAREGRRPYFADLTAFVASERARGPVHPTEDRVYACLDAVPPSSVKVVILGQDPYHGPGQAHGLAFSVPPGTPPPPSLRNILRELRDDTGIDRGDHGDLSGWAREGVLLLNRVLTVREGEAGSHAGRGWETFTDAVVSAIDALPRRVVFVLWGAHARTTSRLVTAPHHVVLESAHPSPLSAHRGFLGSRPFSRANDALAEHGIGPVDWGAASGA